MTDYRALNERLAALTSDISHQFAEGWLTG